MSAEEILRNFFRVFVYAERDGYRIRVAYSEGRDAWALKAVPESMKALLELLRVEAASVPSGRKDTLGHDVMATKPVTVDAVMRALRELRSSRSLTLLCPNVDPRAMERRVTQAAALPGVQVARER